MTHQTGEVGVGLFAPLQSHGIPQGIKSAADKRGRGQGRALGFLSLASGTFSDLMSYSTMPNLHWALRLSPCSHGAPSLVRRWRCGQISLPLTAEVWAGT
jgi:hypothetical protein